VSPPRGQLTLVTMSTLVLPGKVLYS
jgi:hypothetical protein